MKRVQLNDITETYPDAKFFFEAYPLETFMGIGITCSADERVVKEAKVEQTRYKVSAGYKITLVPIDKDFAHESFYQMDFISLCREQPDYYYVTIEDEKVELV